MHGDGGVLYCLAELLTARQEQIGAKLLIVDDERLRDPAPDPERASTAGQPASTSPRPTSPRSALRSACRCTAEAGEARRPLRAAAGRGRAVGVHLPQELRRSSAPREGDDVSRSSC